MNSPSVLVRIRIVAGTLAVALAISVPVMASYGLKVCPILLPLGFGFGCQYLLLFAANLAVLNGVMLWRLARSLAADPSPETSARLLAAPRRSAVLYLVAYVVTVAELLALLAWRHASFASRGPEVLAIVAVLLATLQYYGTAWAVLPATAERDSSTTAAANLKGIWTRGALRVSIPALIAAVVGAHFVLRSTNLSHLLGTSVVAPENPLGMIHVLIFVLLWQVAVMAFYAAAEVDFGRRASTHLQSVTDEDYQHRSATFGWGYWPELFRAMNQLSQGLLERSRLLRGFSSYVSKRVVEDVLDQKLQFGGRREELTVLMADVRDFTAISEALRPEEVVRLLNLYFYAMIEELGREGVTVDKFIGDGLLAYVDAEGRPPDPAEDCRRAARAALAMERRLGSVNDQLSGLGLPRLRVGIGVARGTLVLGNIGSRDRMQFTVIGDTVNLAARLESLCKDLAATIILDRPVWAVLPPDLQAEFQDRGVQAVKGRMEKVRVYAR